MIRFSSKQTKVQRERTIEKLLNSDLDLKALSSICSALSFDAKQFEKKKEFKLLVFPSENKLTSKSSRSIWLTTKQRYSIDLGVTFWQRYVGGSFYFHINFCGKRPRILVVRMGGPGVPSLVEHSPAQKTLFFFFLFFFKKHVSIYSTMCNK